MPLFDKNRIVVTCDFDDNIVVVGGSITGTVNIFVLEPVTLCGASLRYHVDESFTVHTGETRSIPSLDKCSFNIEYILFGHRNTRKTAPIAVNPGHYKYPFSIPVPSNSPPSTNFGSCRGLKRINGERMSVSVDHRVEVNVFVANSLMDKQTSYTVPMVLKCTSPGLLTSAVNGREAHLRNGMSTTLSTKGTVLRALFSSFASATKEQAECDLFIYNTSVSLAETPFLHYAIRGVINCPFHIALVRVTSYGMSAHKNSTEEVVSAVTMPPLDSPDAGVRGKLIISSHALQSSSSFSGKFVKCEFFVTLKLVYTGGVDAGIKQEHRVRVPIDVSHGSLVAEAVPGLVAATVMDGAIMSYTCPEGHGGEFNPVAPVTEAGVAPAAWGNASEMRYNRQVPNGLKGDKDVNNNDSAFARGGADAKNNELYPSDSAMMRGLEGHAADTPHFATPGVSYSPHASATPASNTAAHQPLFAPREASRTHTQQQQSTPASAAYPSSSAAAGGSRVVTYDGVNGVSNSYGPIFDEHGRPMSRKTESKSSAPLPPQHD